MFKSGTVLIKFWVSPWITTWFESMSVFLLPKALLNKCPESFQGMVENKSSKWLFFVMVFWISQYFHIKKIAKSVLRSLTSLFCTFPHATIYLVRCKLFSYCKEHPEPFRGPRKVRLGRRQRFPICTSHCSIQSPMWYQQIFRRKHQLTPTSSVPIRCGAGASVRAVHFESEMYRSVKIQCEFMEYFDTPT